MLSTEHPYNKAYRSVSRRETDPDEWCERWLEDGFGSAKRTFSHALA